MTFDIKQDIRIQFFDESVGEWIDMQCDSFEVNIDRGIDIEQNTFARPKVGTATVRMMKKSLYDLMNPTGPVYKSNDFFRIQAQITPGAWISLFTGIIQNFEIGYNVAAKKAEITLVANDFIKIALNTNITSFSITGTATRSYINVMNQLATAINAIDSRFSLLRGTGTAGSSTFQRADTYLNVPSGELFTQFLDAELGWMYSDLNNQPRFVTRGDITALQGTAFGTGNRVSNIHSNSVDHICMDHLEITYKSDEIANQVRVENIFTGVKTTSTNATSVTNFGRQLADFAVDFDPTVSGGTTYANWAAEVASAATPRRISGVSVPMISDLGEIQDIVTKDIGDNLNVEFRTPGFSDLQEVSIISNLNHVIDANHWELNIGLWKGM
jgi:hypothetical protein